MAHDHPLEFTLCESKLFTTAVVLLTANSV